MESVLLKHRKLESLINNQKISGQTTEISQSQKILNKVGGLADNSRVRTGRSS